MGTCILNKNKNTHR